MNFLSKPLYLVIAGVVATVIIAAGGFFYFRSTQLPKAPPGSPQQAQEEIKRLVAEVGKLIQLPTGEEPTVATVTDIDKLKDQPFFQKAKNGDKVLIYTQARKAILYDPTAKKIVDVAPVNIGTQSAQQAIKIVLRNGTAITGLTTKIEPSVKKSLPNAQVLSKENASKQDYEKTVVVVLNEGVKDEGSKLAKDLGGSVGNLPEGEVRPKDADILVILGKDNI